MHTSPCVVCSAEFQHKRPRTQYCSKDCGSKASYERRRDAGTYVKKRTLYDGQCERCDAPFSLGMNRGKMPRFCSATCCALSAGEVPRRLGPRRPRPPRARQQKQCSCCTAWHSAKAKTCSADCREQLAKQQAHAMRGPLRIAVEGGDHKAVIAAVQARSVVTESGCWQWSGSIKSGYPLVRFGRKTYLVHRLVVEAKYRAALGSQAAHHQCANTSCVNPDHLEPATFAANTLEMISRQSYLARIAELEAELTALAPSHPLLQLIPCA